MTLSLGSNMLSLTMGQGLQQFGIPVATAFGSTLGHMGKPVTLLNSQWLATKNSIALLDLSF